MFPESSYPVGNSRPVTSRQTQPHGLLEKIAQRHLEKPFRKPPADHSRRAFETFLKVFSPQQPCLLDAGCGTGESSVVLAKRYPDCFVVGIDQSEARLAKATQEPLENLLFLRCDLVDFWLLAAQTGVQFQRQTLFYPNPWPKPEHVGRRWPGHPILPHLLACGLVIELRTNWLVYAQEWALVFRLATGLTLSVENWSPASAETAHERKYLRSGHSLWRCTSEAVLRANPSVPENFLQKVTTFE